MKEERYHLALDDYEHRVMIRALNDERSHLAAGKVTTDAVDDLLLKVCRAPKKKIKVVERSEERG